MSSEFVAWNEYNTNRSTPARYILSHMGRHPLYAFGLIAGAFSNAALASAVPYFIGQALDEMVNPDGGGLEAVGLLAWAIVGSQIIRGFLQLSRNLSAATFAQRIERDVRDELYASLLGKNMAFHDRMPVGETMARVTNDVRELNLMMYPGVNLLVGSGFFLLVPVMFSPLIHPQLILVPLIFLIVHVYIQYRFVVMVHPVAQCVRHSFGEMNARLAEALDGIEVVKGAAQEDEEIQNFNRLTDTVRDHFIRQGQIEAQYLSYLLMGLTIVAAFLHGVILYEAGEIEVGAIGSFTLLVALFGFPVFTSLSSLSRIALGYASAGRILNVITTQTDLDRNPTGHSAMLTGKITFQDVNFGYSDNKCVLYDMSFDVKPGQTVAIVGQTGAGKTTVTKLINRIYDTSSGHVLVDGVDVRHWDLASLRSQISIIEQDIFLFSRSIAENIAFGNQDASHETIIDAAKKAQAHDFIMSFPDGYNTVIGQRGVTLSGGQRQRLAIARAFLTDPPVLILDDSTSAIDSATEDKIQQAIWSASQGRTTILITHRLSQIRWADHIIVLKNGRVAAQGDHESLLESSGDYQRIFARYERTQRQTTQEES